MPSLRLTRRSKYGNKRVRLAGEKRPFDSKREAGEWQKLKLLESRQVITLLRRQVPYDLCVNGQKVARYVADFEWWDGKAVVTADAKGYRTPEYKLKKALMKAIHGIEIREL